MLYDEQSRRGNFMRLSVNLTGALSYPKSVGLACGIDYKTSYKMMEVYVLSSLHCKLDSIN